LLALILTPHGRLLLEDRPDADTPLAKDLAERLIRAFANGNGHALLQLGAAEVQTSMPAAFAYWREFASRYVIAVRTAFTLDGRNALTPIPPPSRADLDPLVLASPAMTGAEYLSAAVLESLWTQLDTAFRLELSESKTSVEEFLKTKNPAWNLVGRVHFNLAENHKDDEFPFAFLATYTHRLSSRGKALHVPLGRALTEYGGAANKPRLLSLLLPVQRASEQCDWLKVMVDGGEIYHPLRWTPSEALQLLNDVPALESAGVIVRVPGRWRSTRPPRPKVSAKVGDKPPSEFGVEAMLDFSVEVTLDGEILTEEEIAKLLAGRSGLHYVRGRWVEVNHDKLDSLLEQFRTAEKTVAASGVSFGYAMRLLSGAEVPGDRITDEETLAWSRISAGEWFAKTLQEIRNPANVAGVTTGDQLHAALRPYQEAGVRWLHLLSTLGLGACLADDMGLGKTMQVIALMLVLRNTGYLRGPSLVVAPASLLANWTAELQRFAPTVKAMIAHPSAMSGSALRLLDLEPLKNVDLVITSYGTLVRVPELTRIPWDLAILDEAQAIKNPGAKQSQAVKQLQTRQRIVLTGTPVENRLGDLWSIFDFINPGLLGSAKEFAAFAKELAKRTHNPYGPLRELVRPYILRRLKTDKSVISDLPEKTEVKAYCQLTRKQAALYQEGVKELARQLETREEGIDRRGMILSFLVRFKQICNHPSQWLGDDEWAERESGKLARLREIVEVIAARQEKVLLFTQFREVTSHVAVFLEMVFGRPGLVLHGETEVKKRQLLVKQFQEDERIPFFVLSLKAGGTGLNLTAASHVVHFDRWWNPAVEDQATDRAFRIGQTKNVLVHKFICRGTLEEKIDELIESKQKMSKDILEGSADLLITEMSNEELLKLVALDIHAASAE
jgi:SNF2 domain-containing protein/SNF2 helicase protein/helicase-like protein